MTALTLTDDDVLPARWQNGLWTASDHIHQIADTPVAVNGIPPEEVLESLDIVLKECSSRPSLGPPLAKRPNAWVTRSLDLVEAVEVQVNSLSKKLAFNDGLPDEETLQKLLIQAAEDVESAGISLNSVTAKSEQVLSYKTRVTELLRSIDSRINFLGAGLSPLPAEKGRVMVEAGKCTSIS